MSLNLRNTMVYCVCVAPFSELYLGNNILITEHCVLYVPTYLNYYSYYNVGDSNNK